MRFSHAWALTMLVAAPAMAGSGTTPADPRSVQLPDLSSTDPDVINNGGKFFAFVNPSLTFAQAVDDITECRSFLATGVMRQLPSFVPWEEPSVRPPVVYHSVGLAVDLLLAITMPKIERGQRNNKMRRCMGPRGYQRVAIPEAAWTILNEGDEAQLIAKQAKLATMPGVKLHEVTE